MSLRSLVIILSVIAFTGTARAGNEIEVGATAGVHSGDRADPLAGARVGWFYRHVRPDRWYSSLAGAEAEIALGLGEARAIDRTYRAHAVAQFRTDRRDVVAVPFVLAGGGVLELASGDREGLAYAGGGLKLRITAGFEARLEGRLAVLPDRSTEVLATVGYRFGRW